MVAMGHKTSFCGTDSQYVNCHFLCESPFERISWKTQQILHSKAPSHSLAFPHLDEGSPGDVGRVGKPPGEVGIFREGQVFSQRFSTLVL